MLMLLGLTHLLNGLLPQPQKSSIKTGFYLAAGFPNVIGCIDGTRVRFQAPSVDENAFVNRKGYHSINMQGVCDHGDPNTYGGGRQWLF
uniref:DDE Tnp4 domain-containing protein n=1 Tax=Magallana gigas TaxID=29159 RepID=A0A8W8JGW1_MAGGI